MVLRLALRAALAVVAAAAIGGLQPSWAETPTQAPAASSTKPDAKPDAKTDAKPDVAKPDATNPEAAKPDAAAAPATTATAPATDPFAEDTTLTAKPIVYLKGNGTWDNAFETITGAFKTLNAYIAKEGLKVDGEAMTIFTATDDTGFQFQAAIPIAEPPKTPPKGDVSIGTSPQGHALKFVHRGSYDGLDNTYEAITNYLDDKKLEAKDLFIEQYLTDPLTTNQDQLVVNVYVLVK